MSNTHNGVTFRINDDSVYTRVGGLEKTFGSIDEALNYHSNQYQATSDNGHRTMVSVFNVYNVLGESGAGAMAN